MLSNNRLLLSAKLGVVGPIVGVISCVQKSCAKRARSSKKITFFSIFFSSLHQGRPVFDDQVVFRDVFSGFSLVVGNFSVRDHLDSP